MTPVTDPPDTPQGPASPKRARVPARPVSEVLRDLEQERHGLVDAVARLKLEVRAKKDRFLSPRVLAIAVGAVVALVVLRRWLKSRSRAR
jgi:hypothetical protein